MRKPDGLLPSRAALALMTDLYELTMAAGYFATGAGGTVAFEANVRVLPPNRSYLVAAGLEQALQYILDLRFDGQAVGWLRSQPQFARVPGEFFEYLRGLRFRGDVHAVPEGTVVFAGEPLVRVEADLIEAQLLETYLLTCLNLQTLVASKAARIVEAAQGRPVVDFGARRAHGPQAGLLAARASIIGGCAGTSNVEAARALGVPAVGTMAHSWIMAFGDEAAAFRACQEVFPDHTICLIDTYGTLRGAEIAAKTLGPRLQGVRLDSGDLLELSRQVRRILDENGCRQAKIVASSDLNEYAIRDLVAAGAPIDSFGVGTDMVTSKDAPALSVVYKLVAVRKGAERVTGNGPRVTQSEDRRPDEPRPGWRAVTKQSTDKATLGGCKQVWRRHGPDGRAAGDMIGLAEEALVGELLLRPYIAGGRLIADLPSAAQIAERAHQQVEALPAGAKELRGTYAYLVEVSDALRAAQPGQRAET